MAVATRGCGDRVSGGVYLCTRLSTDGTGEPIESFLIDPPMIVDPASIGLSPIGVTLVEREGVTHVIDWVGEDSYKNTADLIEEVRRFGLSRRVSKNLDFSRLDHRSKILLVHARAQIDNATDYYKARPADEAWCPTGNVAHVQPDYQGMCLAIAWEDIEGGIAASDHDAPGGVLCGNIRSDITGLIFHRRRDEERAVVRTLPSFSYRGMRAPDGVRPRYRPAIFASLPLHGIEVVRDAVANSHVGAAEKAGKSRLEVTIEDE